MTDKETSIFKKYQKTIIHVQNSIVRKYESFKNVGNKASDEISSDILRRSASIIIEKRLENKPEDEVKKFLSRWFNNVIRNLYRKEIRVVSRTASQDELDALESENTPLEEDSTTMAKLSLAYALKDCSRDILALCKVYLEFRSFDAAIRILGWSKGKIYRTKEAMEALFRKKIVSCGGFFEPRDICKWRGVLS